MQAGRIVFWATGAAALPLSFGSTVLTIVNGVNTSTSYLHLAIVAAALEAISVTGVVLVLVLRGLEWSGRIQQSRLRRLIVPSACALFAVVAGTVTLAELALRKSENGADSKKAGWITRLDANLAICAVALVAEVIFFTAAIIVGPRGHGDKYTRSEEDAQPATPLRATTPQMALRISTPPRPFAHKDPLPSPTLTNNSSTSLPSLRSSVQQVVRPIASKTRLLTLRSTSSAPDVRLSYSIRSSLDSLHHIDGFDSWDTSSVDSHNRDAVMQTAARRPLEPIPGSRPASRVLESFEARDSAAPTVTSTPSRTEQPSSSTSSSPVVERPTTSYSGYTARSRHAASTVTLTPSSRPTSISVNEAHIHPLFRTDSPTPPPAATPGTIIHASPMGGQFITTASRPYNRPRAGSKETLRGRSHSLLRSQSLDNVTLSTLGTKNTYSRETTPPSRELTPPIPDFVLSGVS